MIEVVRGYRSELFREDLKKLYEKAGIKGQNTVFLFNDTQVIENSFLEDINGMLTSGEVSNLYPPRSSPQVRESVRNDVRAAGLPETERRPLGALHRARARSNVHIVLCMSPVGENYRNYVRMFPALVSCTTINWFSEWPPDALKEVALQVPRGRCRSTKLVEPCRPSSRRRRRRCSPSRRRCSRASAGRTT